MEIDFEIMITVDLPEEVIIEILLRLPVRSLVRFRCVSKSWLLLISSYKFAMAHLKISTKNNLCTREKLIFGSKTLPIDLYTCSISSIIMGSNSVGQVYPTTNANLLFDRVRFDFPFAKPDDAILIVGSCNGLVCVNILSTNTIILWNPTTRKSKRLLRSRMRVASGFGYDERNDDYKMVEVLGFLTDYGEYEIRMKVYSLRTNAWKPVTNWPGGYTFRGPGQFLNGAIHWSVCEFDNPTGWVIVSHDLATDTFIEFPLPDLGAGPDDVRVEVKILNGCLALFCEHNAYMDVWVMKAYGVTESWTKFVRIPFLVDFREHNSFVRPCPLFFSSNGKALINYGSRLSIYDFSNPESHEFSSSVSLQATTYVESLVSPSLDDEIIIGRTRTFPPEITAQILLRLPVKSLLRFKSVSKEWYSQISSPRFVKAHLKTSTKNGLRNHVKVIFGAMIVDMELYTCSINSMLEGYVFYGPYRALTGCVYNVYGENYPFDNVYITYPFVAPHTMMLRLVGSCNGLVCLCVPPNNIILVNPATRVSRILPHYCVNEHDFYLENYNISYSFGYDEVNRDYKVVEFMSFEHEPYVYETRVKVYSMRTNTWKNLPNWPGGDTYYRSGKLLKGSLYWSVIGFNGLAKWVIVSYDLETDNFARLPIPNDVDNYANLEVGILGGCLALYCKGNVYMDIWLMKETWTRVVRVPFFAGHAIPRPVFLSENGKILMNYGSSLRIYDSITRQPHHIDPTSAIDAITYVESLVSLTLDDDDHDL